MPLTVGYSRCDRVALRKESVDRNIIIDVKERGRKLVALRKESVDRNTIIAQASSKVIGSLSARRAWIEINVIYLSSFHRTVALRKESVDRNYKERPGQKARPKSLSARRAWIEITSDVSERESLAESLSARRAWIEMFRFQRIKFKLDCRSPQGERG